MNVRIPGSRRQITGPAVEEFLNPYNFVSTPDRSGTATPEGLADSSPASHATVADDTYSARIPITITTRTPLLIPDQPRAMPPNGKTPRAVAMRTDPSGAPLLSGSTVKGMLRSAYEAITNSRFGVTNEAGMHLGAMRQRTRGTRHVYPAVVTRAEDNSGTVEVSCTDWLLPVGVELPSDPLPAPWLPRAVAQTYAQRVGIETVDLDGREVFARLHLQWHPQVGRQAPYYLWRVAALADSLDDLPEGDPPNAHAWANAQTRAVEPVQVRCRIHWTAAQFTRKHDERVVVLDTVSATPLDFETSTWLLSRELVRSWKDVLRSYQRAHEHDRNLNGLGTYVTDPDRWALAPGRTLHLRFDDNETRIIAVSPSMIGRQTHANAPTELIPDAHRKAPHRSRLSPADRIFGWTADGTDLESNAALRGHKGQIRVDPPEVRGGAQRITPFKNPIALFTLNGPKTSQHRFYSGDSKQQPLAQEPDRPFDAGAGHTLRGRKFYLAQPEIRDAPEYWQPSRKPMAWRPNRFREFLAPEPVNTNVATAILGWVKPKTVFTTTLHVTNISGMELGALLWLLALPDEATLGLGLGKPLGFGAVRIEADWNAVDICSVEQQRKRYRSVRSAFAAPTVSDSIATCQAMVDRYDATLREHLPRVREEFLDVVLGFTGTPVHYPRASAGTDGRPAPVAEGFHWWVTNANGLDGEAAPNHALPPLGTDKPPTLPYLRSRPGRRR